MSEIAFRWSGILLVAGAALLGIAIVLVSLKPVINQVFSPGVALLFLLSSIFLLLSLPAMYARQANAAGWLGLAGHALLQTGILLLVVLAATPILYPSLKTASGENLVAFLLGIALTLGLLLTGIATIRAGSLSPLGRHPAARSHGRLLLRFLRRGVSAAPGRTAWQRYLWGSPRLCLGRDWYFTLDRQSGSGHWKGGPGLVSRGPIPHANSRVSSYIKEAVPCKQ